MVSAAPMEGVRDCFEFITRAIIRPERKDDYKVVLPEGVKGLSLKNLVFTFRGKLLELPLDELFGFEKKL